MTVFINLLVLFFFMVTFSAIPSGDAMNVTDTGGNPLQEEVLYYIKSDSEGYVAVEDDNKLRFQRNNSQSVTDMKFKFSFVGDENHIQIKTETGKEVFTKILTSGAWYLMAGEKPQNVSHEFDIQKHADDDGAWSLFVIFNSKAHVVFVSSSNTLYTKRGAGRLPGIALKFEFTFSAIPPGDATEVTDAAENPLREEVLYYIKSDSEGYVAVEKDNKLRFQGNNFQSVTDMKFKFSRVGDGNYIQIKTETGKEVFAQIPPRSGKPWYLMAKEKPENVWDVFVIQKHDDDDGTWHLFVIFNSTAHAVFASENALYTNEWSVGLKGIALKFDLVFFTISTVPGGGGATEITDAAGNPLREEDLYYIKSESYGYVTVDPENKLHFGMNNSQSVTNTKFKFSVVGDENYIQIKTETGKLVFVHFQSHKQWYLMAGEKPENVSHVFGIEKYDDDATTWSLSVILDSKAYAVSSIQNDPSTKECKERLKFERVMK